MSDVVLETTDGEPVVLPEEFSVADASFERSGEDLIMTEPDRSRIVISDYFADQPQPNLTTPDGAQVTGAVVNLLAGPSTSVQDIAAGTDAEAQAIGTFNSISGKVYVIRIDGTRVELEIDTPLYSGDILETGPDGARRCGSGRRDHPGHGWRRPPDPGRNDLRPRHPGRIFIAGRPQGHFYSRQRPSIENRPGRHGY